MLDTDAAGREASVSLQILDNDSPGRAWTPLLTIDPTTDTLSPWAEEEQAPLMRAWLISPDSIVPPEQLYAIHSETWGHFLAKLGRPELVSALGLHKHRHLWRGYEFACAAPTPELAEMRAKIIGQYHFLLSVAFMPFQSLIKIRSFATFPLYIFNASLADKESVYAAIHEDLHNGQFDATKMQALHPVFTPEFLEKIAHCTSFSEVDRLAWMMVNYADMPGSGQPAETRLMEATERMPSSHDTPADFGCMMRLGGELFTSSSAHVAGGFLFNDKTSWSRDGKKINGFFATGQRDAMSPIRGYINALYGDLVYRSIQLNFPEEIPEYSPDYIYNFPELFQALLADNQSILQMQRLQQRWRRNFMLLEALKPAAENDCWEPLMNNCQINGFFVNVLTSGRSLRLHDAQMEYGVGGFSRLCLANVCNILQITDTRGRETIVSLGYSKAGGIVVSQHFGAHACPPFPEHVQLAKALVQGMNTGLVPVNWARCDAPPAPASHAIYPWSLEDDALQERVYEAWRGLKLLPPVLDAPNHAAMLAQCGIMERLQESVERIETTRLMP